MSSLFQIISTVFWLAPYAQAAVQRCSWFDDGIGACHRCGRHAQQPRDGGEGGMGVGLGAGGGLARLSACAGLACCCWAPGRVMLRCCPSRPLPLLVQPGWLLCGGPHRTASFTARWPWRTSAAATVAPHPLQTLMSRWEAAAAAGALCQKPGVHSFKQRICLCLWGCSDRGSWEASAGCCHQSRKPPLAR
jgi:hypothetical protein